MKKIFNIPLTNTTPSSDTIIRAQGVPTGITPDARTAKIAEEAITIYKKSARPTGIVMEISKDEFEAIFEGEGMNEPASPVRPIYQQSDDLALYAVTIGQDICEDISRQFTVGEYALGSMVDAAASEATEMTAQVIEDIYRQHLREIKRFSTSSGILRFSPGYCGWHISGQKELFRSLRPEDIDIKLNSSFLMSPIKSISGIIISGKKDIFKFDDSFSFCADCTTHSCRERIEAIQQQ